ncbi:amidase [bacterium]|nr:amidase [bacterium]
MNIKLENLTAIQIGKLVNERTIKPREVIEYFIDRINKRNKSINAFTYTRFDYALKEADKLEMRLEKGEYCGPFAGVPFAMKDFLSSKKGWTHSYGGVKSLIQEDQDDSPFTCAMEALGGIAIGKTNAPQFGFRGTCDNYLYGATRNPFNLDYNSGGSSGGSAAAVSDGLVIISEAGDAGGSIRIPASWCNLFGFMASFGLVPSVSRPDAWSASHPYCINGAVTKDVYDMLVLFKEMAKYDPRDPFSIPFYNIDTTFSDISNLKIGYTYDFNIYKIDKRIKNMMDETISILKKNGFNIEKAHFDLDIDSNYITDEWCKSISIDTSIMINKLKENGFDLIADHSDELPPEFIEWYYKSRDINLNEYYDYHILRTKLLDCFNNAFNNFDLIISPVTLIPPVLNTSNTIGPKYIDNKEVNRVIGFTTTYLSNFIGYPSASIPSGIFENNLPLGFQVIAKRFHDKDIFDFAYQFSKIKPWINNFDIALDRKIDI